VANRAGDWLRQAEKNPEQAAESASSGRHEWGCLAAQQAAEMAVKALHLGRGQEAWGRVVRELLEKLPEPLAVDADMLDAAGTVFFTPNERRVAEDRRDCYWLYVVTNCDAEPKLAAIKDPARFDWQEVIKVQHYSLSTTTLAQQSGGN
jgi:HEPN domain-containing protein